MDMVYKLVFLRFCFIFMILSSLFNCREEIEKSDKKWSEYIISHTHGQISSHSSIELALFEEKLRDSQNIPSEIKDIFQFEPEIKGNTTWGDHYKLIFVPDAPLPHGERYKARVNLKGFIDQPNNLNDFIFHFEVVRQAIEVRVDGLLTHWDGSSNDLTLKGWLSVADKIDPTKIEKILKAHFKGTILPIRWEHNYPQHSFSVAGIHRAKEDSLINLKWEGDFIGINVSGEEEVYIPSKNKFEVLELLQNYMDITNLIPNQPHQTSNFQLTAHFQMEVPKPTRNKHRLIIKLGFYVSKCIRNNV